MTNEAKKVFSTWEWGCYLGRSMISAEGHPILKDSTGAVITSRSVRAGLVDVDDELLEPLVAEDPEPVVMPVPPHRLREKTYVAKVAEQELMAEEQASKLLRSGNITPQTVSRMLQHLVKESAADTKRRGQTSGHRYLGGFRRGPFSGAQPIPAWKSTGQRHTRFFVGFLWVFSPTQRCLRIGTFPQLWAGDTGYYQPMDRRGAELFFSSRRSVWLSPLKPGLQFNPKIPHAVVRTPEWVVVGYTPNGFSVDVERDRLQSFRSKGSGQSGASQRRARCSRSANRCILPRASDPWSMSQACQVKQVCQQVHSAPRSQLRASDPWSMSQACQGIGPLEHVPGVPGEAGRSTGAVRPVAAQGIGPLEHVPGVPGEAGLSTGAVSVSPLAPGAEVQGNQVPASNTTTISEPATGSNASLPNLQAISEKKGEVIPAARACPAWLPRLSATRADPSPRITSGPSQLKSVEPAVIEHIEAHLADLDANERKLEITHEASPKEARQHLEKWKESMEEELNGQLASGCLTRRDGEEARQLLKRPDAEVLSSLNVWTVKPPKPNSNKMYRRKVRTVACGNQSEVTSEVNTYASGARAG